MDPCTRCSGDDATQGRNHPRRWPHQVALSADKLRGVESVVHRFANGRSARRTFFTRYGDRDFVVFCFAKPEDRRAVRRAALPGRCRPMTVIRTSSEQQRALKPLASSRHGVNEELLIRGHGFSRWVLSSLIRRRLAVTQREVVMAGGRAIEVVRLRITAAGRRAIEAA